MPVFSALNGHLTDTALAYLPWPEASYLRLRPDAAASAGRLAAAFRARFGRPLYVSDGYRTFVQQQTLKIQKGSFAADPGTSNHGLGVALDLASNVNVDGSVQHRWMEANGPSFGWTNPFWAVDWDPSNGQHEPWHWEFDPTQDQHAHAAPPPRPVTAKPAPVAVRPAPLTSSIQEDDMALIIYARGGFWLKDGPRIDGLDAPTLGNLRAQKFADGTPRFPEVAVTDALFDTWRADTSPVPTLVRAPSRGVGLLGGAGGFTGLSSQDDVNRFHVAGAHEVAISDDDFDRLSA